jgi:hypothetical protein
MVMGNATISASMKERCHACTKSYEGLSFDSFDA